MQHMWRGPSVTQTGRGRYTLPAPSVTSNSTTRYTTRQNPSTICYTKQQKPLHRSSTICHTKQQNPLHQPAESVTPFHHLLHQTAESVTPTGRIRYTVPAPSPNSRIRYTNPAQTVITPSDHLLRHAIARILSCKQRCMTMHEYAPQHAPARWHTLRFQDVFSEAPVTTSTSVLPKQPKEPKASPICSFCSLPML